MMTGRMKWFRRMNETLVVMHNSLDCVTRVTNCIARVVEWRLPDELRTNSRLHLQFCRLRTQVPLQMPARDVCPAAGAHASGADGRSAEAASLRTRGRDKGQGVGVGDDGLYYAR